MVCPRATTFLFSPGCQEEVGSEEVAPLPVLPEKARVARLPWALATFLVLCLVLTAPYWR